jgi:hypothetical protein
VQSLDFLEAISRYTLQVLTAFRAFHCTRAKRTGEAIGARVSESLKTTHCLTTLVPLSDIDLYLLMKSSFFFDLLL